MADNSVDTLSIEINANSKKASDGIDSLVSALERLRSNLSSGTLGAMKEAAKASSEIGSSAGGIKEFSKAVKDLNSTSKKSASGISKLFSSIGRIAFYRAIRTAIKEVGEGFKEGVQNIVLFEKAMNMADSLDSTNYRISQINANLKELKNQSGSLGTQLIDAFDGPLNFIIEKVERAIEFVTMLFAALNGKTTYLKAKEIEKGSAAWDDYADRLKKTAKEAKNLLGFDELNVLKENNANTSYNKQLSAAKEMFEEAKIADWLVPLAEFNKKIRENKGEVIGDLTALAEMAAIIGTVGLAVKLLTSLFGGKNKALKSQTKFTLEDSEATADYRETVSSLVPALALAASAIGMGGLAGSLGKELYPKLQELIEKLNKGETQTALQGISNESASMSNEYKNALENANKNTEMFTSKTSSDFNRWKQKIYSVSPVFGAIATAVFRGLTNSGENMVSFFNSTSQSTANWGTNIANNFGKTFQKITDNISDSLNSSWKTFKDFMSATGEKVTSFFAANKTKIQVGLALTGLTVGAIALAPYTGGASLAAPLMAFADGGFPNQGDLFWANENGPELVGRIGNKTAVANQDQIISGVASGVRSANDDLINAIYAVSNQIISAVQSADHDVYIDGKKITSFVSSNQFQRSRMYGV